MVHESEINIYIYTTYNAKPLVEHNMSFIYVLSYIRKYLD